MMQTPTSDPFGNLQKWRLEFLSPHDGLVVHRQERQAAWIDAQVTSVEAVEFYRLACHAPRPCRAVAADGHCSILALWSRRTPPDTKRPVLRLLGTVAATALPVLLIR
jgi:hypothetical protein